MKLRTFFRKLRHPVRTAEKSAVRKVKRSTKSYLKRGAKAALIAYLVALVPVNVISTSFKQSIPLNQVGTITEQLVQKGPLHFLSFGTLDNLVPGLKKGPVQPQVVVESSELSEETAQSESDITDQTEIDQIDYYQLMGRSGLTASDFNFEGIEYSELDELGRTGQARGVITQQMIENSKGFRQDFEKGSNPSGWPDGESFKNEKVEIHYTTGHVYHGYFYNRSHLIADQLGGRAFRRNLITGTRPQNVGHGSGGMRYTESKVVNFLSRNPDQEVLYIVTPNYMLDEVVPRTVTVQMLSTDGTLDERVKVYNQCIGFDIDYQTGQFEKVTK